MATKQELIELNKELNKELNNLKQIIWGTMREKESTILQIEALAKEYEKVINILSGRLIALYSGDRVEEQDRKRGIAE
jgi:hypothetical protein